MAAPARHAGAAAKSALLLSVTLDHHLYHFRRPSLALQVHLHDTQGPRPSVRCVPLSPEAAGPPTLPGLEDALPLEQLLAPVGACKEQIVAALDCLDSLLPDGGLDSASSCVRPFGGALQAVLRYLGSGGSTAGSAGAAGRPGTAGGGVLDTSGVCWQWREHLCICSLFAWSRLCAAVCGTLLRLPCSHCMAMSAVILLESLQMAGRVAVCLQRPWVQNRHVQLQVRAVLSTSRPCYARDCSKEPPLGHCQLLKPCRLLLQVPGCWLFCQGPPTAGGVPCCGSSDLAHSSRPGAPALQTHGCPNLQRSSGNPAQARQPPRRTAWTPAWRVLPRWAPPCDMIGGGQTACRCSHGHRLGGRSPDGCQVLPSVLRGACRRQQDCACINLGGASVRVCEAQAWLLSQAQHMCLLLPVLMQPAM